MRLNPGALKIPNVSSIVTPVGSAALACHLLGKAERGTVLESLSDTVNVPREKGAIQVSDLMSTPLETQDYDQVIRVQEAAYKDSARFAPQEITTYLLEHVGQRITTVATGVADARPVRSWRDGTATPHEEHDWKLRLLYRVVRPIHEVYGAPTARAFLRSSNPQLGDESPLLVIADKSQKSAEPAVLAATRAFLEG